MKRTLSQILTIVFLLSIFSFNFGSGQLICWRCDPCPDPFSNTSALVSAVNCTSTQIFCVKNTLQVLNQPAEISKGCEQSCSSSSLNYFGQGDFVDCCNTNYCNLSTRNQLSVSIYLFILIFYHQQN